MTVQKRHPFTNPAPVRAACQGLVLACALLAGNAMAQKPHQGVLDAATQQKDEALKLLERMVNIDSGSASTEGLDKVRGIAVEELRKLGARIETCLLYTSDAADE